jgi:hypothetical protein
MVYLTGKTLSGPREKRWGCDGNGCTATVLADTEEDQRMAQVALGWREICGLHLCPQDIQAVGHG